MDRIPQPTSTDKKKEMISSKKDIKVFNQSKKQDDTSQTKNLNQKLGEIKKEIDRYETVKNEINKKAKKLLSTNEKFESINKSLNELKERFKENSEKILLNEKELKILKKEQKQLVYEQNELEQNENHVHQKIQYLQLLESKINNLEKSIQNTNRDSQRRSIKSIGETIQVLRQANTELGDRQEEKDKLNRIEYGLLYIGKVNKLISERRREIPEITDVHQYIKEEQASFKNTIKYDPPALGRSVGSSESLAHSIRPLRQWISERYQTLVGSHPDQLMTYDDIITHEDSSHPTIHDDGFLPAKKTEFDKKIKKFQKAEKVYTEKLKNLKTLQREIFVEGPKELKKFGEKLLRSDRNNNEQGEQHKLFLKLRVELLNKIPYIKSKDKQQKWAGMLDEIFRKYWTIRQYNRTGIAENDIKRVNAKIQACSHYALAVKELHESHKEFVKYKYECNKIFLEIEQHSLEERKNLLNRIGKLLPDEQVLWVISNSIKENTEKLQSIQKNLEATNPTLQSTEHKIQELSEEITKDSQYHSELEKLIKETNEKISKILWDTLPEDTKKGKKTEDFDIYYPAFSHATRICGKYVIDRTIPVWEDNLFKAVQR